MDDAATVFVEICTRLDGLLDAQQKTNEILARLELAVQDHLRMAAEDGSTLGAPHRRRGLGHLMPYGEDNVQPIVVTSVDPIG
jgi:hypothetical protein